jgi:hypothetical protein
MTPDLDAPIVPGRCAAGVTLGASAEIFDRGREGWQAESVARGVLLRQGPVTVWLEGGVVVQVMVGRGYRGGFMEQLRVGSAVGELTALGLRWLEDDEDALVLEGVPGISFEVSPDDWTHHMRDGAAIIHEWHVYPNSGMSGARGSGEVPP